MLIRLKMIDIEQNSKREILITHEEKEELGGEMSNFFYS